ncbi:unnamed protein product [Clonostachys rosea f. rosea IK726]|uniref:Uncharacterized protein n=1 Tax=Clonostachys rosea f. rosea IK726 TaxID=1349383 RepID=A0ACA9UFC3_BIOOC|nr:unnamed protein product [Clonostachys rosea f. rosea IK726]
MALSKVEGREELYVGGLWAMRRSDSLVERRITHVLSMVAIDPATLKNFKDEPWSQYGREIEHLSIDIDDTEDANLLIELPRAVRFISQALGSSPADLGAQGEAAASQDHGEGKSRSVSAVVAYLLWRFPGRFDSSLAPNQSETPQPQTRRETAAKAVDAAVGWIQRTRPMAEPNEGFMKQLQLWWEMGCPVEGDIETHPIYQRWAYDREVQEHLAVGQAPSRLRFEDEIDGGERTAAGNPGLSLRCKKCRRSLATAPFIIDHQRAEQTTAQCQHHFIEPLSWMRDELEKGRSTGDFSAPTLVAAPAWVGTIGRGSSAPAGLGDARRFRFNEGVWTMSS